MHINLTGHHVEITESIRKHVIQKFDKLERFFEHINNVHIVLSREKLHQIAEATLHINNGEIHAKSNSDNMYTSVDSLSDKLAKQLNKHKKKMNHH
ncbi:ribosome hibernation promoting factor [Candidatus Enterovibrio escicola]|uniref:ribosome hibernation promoting factor n=1 Tax=Candidatus Enterovibrio escicola TaxID=1927127 RepID=UPI001237D0E0|nr:ribosome hibernation promoting factor [Candidatus Enterovibrio escacola]